MADRVAITGATGAIGGRVARRLAEAGVPLRLVVRDPARAPDLKGTDVDVEISVATYDDPTALRAAFAKTASALFVSGAEAPNRIEQHRNVVGALADSGVADVVYTSFLGAGPECTFTFGRDHFHTEEAIDQAGLGFTFLRDSLYLDFLPYFAGEGEIRAPAGDGHFAPVARRDVAEVASAALLDRDVHRGQTYDLTGVDRVTMAEAAALLSRVAGRPVPYVAETLEEAYASRAHYEAEAWEVAGWVTSYAAIAEGELDVVSDAVERVTGRAPTGIEPWLAAHPAAWAHLKA